MATEIRFAVLRITNSDDRREWWHRKSEHFERSWEERSLWEKPPGALAVIWKYRDQDSNNNYYTYKLVRVVRKYRDTAMMKTAPVRTEIEEAIP